MFYWVSAAWNQISPDDIKNSFGKCNKFKFDVRLAFGSNERKGMLDSKKKAKMWISYYILIFWHGIICTSMI